METKTHFAFRGDIWDDTGDSIVEHVAGVDDFEVAEATYRAAVARWPAARITLRQGVRVAHDTGQQLAHSSPRMHPRRFRCLRWACAAEN
jgi:hypothetical protein